MNSEELQSRFAEDDLWHVLLFTTPLPFPMNFVASHPWLVTVSNGKMKRWEVWQNAGRCERSWGHVHLDLFRPEQGMRRFYGSKGNRRSGKLIASLSGEKGSLAEEMVNFIENESQNYHAANRYRFFPGPNSNTYVQWVINHFPESNFRLPLSCVGKDHSASSGKIYG